jgi:hypothetical protein
LTRLRSLPPNKALQLPSAAQAFRGTPPRARFARRSAPAIWRRGPVSYRIRSAALAAERRSVRQPPQVGDSLPREEIPWLKKWPPVAGSSAAARCAKAGSAGGRRALGQACAVGFPGWPSRGSRGGITPLRRSSYQPRGRASRGILVSSPGTSSAERWAASRCQAAGSSGTPRRASSRRPGRWCAWLRGWGSGRSAALPASRLVPAGRPGPGRPSRAAVPAWPTGNAAQSSLRSQVGCAVWRRGVVSYPTWSAALAAERRSVMRRRRRSCSSSLAPAVPSAAHGVACVCWSPHRLGRAVQPAGSVRSPHRGCAALLAVGVPLQTALGRQVRRGSAWGLSGSRSTRRITRRCS